MGSHRRRSRKKITRRSGGLGSRFLPFLLHLSADGGGGGRRSGQHIPIFSSATRHRLGISRELAAGGAGSPSYLSCILFYIPHNTPDNISPNNKSCTCGRG